MKGDESEALGPAVTASESIPLFSKLETGEFRSQWIKTQTCFVDVPRETVRDADNLVAAVMQRLAEGFANERSGLESQWDRDGDVSTKDLRVALQRYRSFFDRLLNSEDDNRISGSPGGSFFPVVVFDSVRPHHLLRPPTTTS